MKYEIKAQFKADFTNFKTNLRKVKRKLVWIRFKNFIKRWLHMEPKKDPKENNILAKFGYIMLGLFCILSVILLGVGYILYINGFSIK